MTRGSAPGTSISRAQISGTLLSPIRRAANAGNSAFRSVVQVKMQLTRSSMLSWLRSSTWLTSSSVASRILSASFASTVVAPRRARSLTVRHCLRRALAARAALGAGGFAEPLDLGRSQRPVVACGELVETQRSERRALERDHAGAHRLDHAPDLPLASLADRQLEHPRLDLAHARRQRPAVLQLHALAPRAQRGLRHPLRPPPHAVVLLHLVARVRGAVGQLAVVRQEDQAGGLGVEPAHRVEPTL